MGKFQRRHPKQSFKTDSQEDDSQRGAEEEKTQGLGDAYLSTLFLLSSQHFYCAEIGSEQIPVKVN